MNEPRRLAQQDNALGCHRRDYLRLVGAGAISLALGGSRTAFAWPGLSAKGTIYVGDEPPPAQAKDGVSLLAIDVATGESKIAFDLCDRRARVSPDGRRVAYSHDRKVWVCDLAEGAKPMRILDCEANEFAAPVCWSGDGKQLIVSPYHRDEKNDHWSFRTVRVTADGTGKEDLPLPSLDGVWDWSSDGQWVVTASHREAKIGWQLYVMHPDGSGDRQITEGGNPFAPRLSPDGKQVLFHDGTTEERSGIWVVDLEGKNKRKVVATGTVDANACWSPDGKFVAVAYRDLEGRGNGRDLSRVEVMDLNGENRVIFSTQGHATDASVDWRS